LQCGGEGLELVRQGPGAAGNPDLGRAGPIGASQIRRILLQQILNLYPGQRQHLTERRRRNQSNVRECLTSARRQNLIEKHARRIHLCSDHQRPDAELSATALTATGANQGADWKKGRIMAEISLQRRRLLLILHHFIGSLHSLGIHLVGSLGDDHVDHSSTTLTFDISR